MNNNMNHNQMKASVEAARAVGQERYKTSSKKKLMDNMEKKVKTTMIGALASFENEFGSLWGQNADNLSDSLSEEEQYWLDRWDGVRTEILNNGNNQIRAAMEEIAQYTLTWNRYKTDFIVKKQGNQE